MNENFSEGLISVRFTGEDFSSRGVSIYDLSMSLLAIQRIVHKTYLSMEGRLEKGAYPKKEERQELALQINSRKRASDAFSLIPILADPATQHLMKNVTEYFFSGIVSYYTGKVLEHLGKEKDQNRRIYIASLHADVVNIVDRIDASGSVESISLGSPINKRETLASFNSESKEYLNELKQEFVLGDYQTIRGRVYKLYPTSKIVAIRREGGKTVSIFLDRQNFDQIRFTRETSPIFDFSGRARYQFGVTTLSISEFEADSIEYIPEEDE